MAQISFRILLLLAMICVSPAFVSAQQKDAAMKPEAAAEATDIGSAPDQKALDNLQKFLAGSKWNGTFTMRKTEGKLHTEEYEVISAEREPTGDNWVLMSRIKYMKKDYKVAVPLSIKWIDRTPVIVMDQVTLPGAGTFDARVIIRKGMYAGTWAHGKIGGHLFGEITTAAAAKAEGSEMKKSKTEMSELEKSKMEKAEKGKLDMRKWKK